MCDTMGRLTEQGALFAKNSDRCVNEPQVVEWHPAQDHAEKTVRTTYIEIEEVAHTYGLLLSRPSWLWGGEMGVNEHGVCIGNEAVFTRGRYAKTGLIGMDILRLALERADSAAKAVDVILDLIDRYGQGGDCGYDHPFFYNNSFLVLDRTSLYILETAGKQWVVKECAAGSISNRLSIDTEGTRYSGNNVVDFKRKHIDPLYSFFSGSAKRVAATAACIAKQPDVGALFAGLRTHDEHVADHPLCCDSMTSPCMHGGSAIGNQSTASLVVEVGERVMAWVTGSSTPCISLFKPFLLGNPTGGPVFAKNDRAAVDYWQTREAFHRSLIGKVLPAQFYEDRDALERNWVLTTRTGDAKEMAEIAAQAAREEIDFYSYWSQHLPEGRHGKVGFLRYWDNHTALLATPDKPYREG